MAYPGAAGAETLALMTSGLRRRSSGSEIVGGLVVPFLVLVFAKNRERTGLVGGASVLVIAGVLCKRLWLLFTSFIVPNVEGARASCPTAAGRFSALRTDGARSADRAGRRVGGHAGIHGPGLEAARARDRDRERVSSRRCSGRAR